jgi:hypothetical protein
MADLGEQLFNACYREDPAEAARLLDAGAKPLDKLNAGLLRLILYNLSDKDICALDISMSDSKELATLWRPALRGLDFGKSLLAFSPYHPPDHHSAGSKRGNCTRWMSLLRWMEIRQIPLPRLLITNFSALPDEDLAVLQRCNKEKIEHVFLSSDNLPLGLPTFLQQLTSLKRLDVGLVPVVSPLLELHRLRELVFLNGLRGNETSEVMTDSAEDPSKLSSSVCTQICSLSCLEVLRLGYRSITSRSLAGFTRLTRLQTLQLTAYSHVKDDDLEFLSSLTKLSHLTVDASEDRAESLTDGGLLHIEDLSSLKTLSLCNWTLTYLGIDSIARLTKLEILEISYCTIPVDCFSRLGRLHQLKSLSLGGWEVAGIEIAIGDDHLSHLHHLKCLEVFELLSTQVTDVGLFHAFELPCIKTINLEYVHGITRHGVNVLKRRLKDAGRCVKVILSNNL